jgi:hypothetical protein
MVSGMSTEEEKEGTIDEEVSEEREVEETSEEEFPKTFNTRYRVANEKY